MTVGGHKGELYVGGRYENVFGKDREAVVVRNVVRYIHVGVLSNMMVMKNVRRSRVAQRSASNTKERRHKRARKEKKRERNHEAVIVMSVVTKESGRANVEKKRAEGGEEEKINTFS